MGKDDKSFRHESLQNPRSIITYLDALRDGFQNGTLSFSDPHGEIEMRPQGLVRFEVQADQKRDRARLILSFEWKDQSSKRSRAWPLVVKAEEE